ncbi:MAG: hypothetical protein KA807_11695 [Prolixibacteraceae bacterium]|nr:hypothetical protein [Prolixibacteraceae bacterium]
MKKNGTAIIIITLLTSIILLLIFKSVILNPNAYLFNKTGETIKGYYNFSYNLQYGSGIKHEGVNYPYSEHIMYDNNQPLLLWVVKLVNKIIPINSNGVGVLNLLMIFSILLSIPFIFLILRRSKLPVWYSSVITLLIVFLSPQLQRFQAQIELSYVFYIPMIWYFLIKIKENKNKWLWIVLLLISGTGGGFIDKYYLAFFSFFIFSIIIGELWINRKDVKKVFNVCLMLFIIAIIPVLIVNGFTALTDWVNDRPSNPYGFSIYTSNLFSIFLPFDQLFKLLPENIYNMTRIKWEGQSFVGLPAMIIAVVFSLNFIYRFYTRKDLSVIFPQKELNIFLFGSFLILLFSMCFPGTTVLAKIFPSLKQFRALGRFSWIFFYVFTVYSAVYIYNFHLKLKEEGKSKKAMWILILTLAFWSYDSITNSTISFKNIVKANDKIDKDRSEYLKKISQAGIDPKQFQAILFLPFANSTGDKLMFERGLNTFPEAIKVSYNTGLPIIESLSPYLSFSNALSNVQLLSDLQIKKERLKDLNNLPILLLCNKDSLTTEEKLLKNKSTLLWEDKYISLSSIDPEIFNKDYNEGKINSDKIISTLKGNEYFKSDTLPEVIFYKNYDDSASKISLVGKGAFTIKKKEAIIFEENFFSKGIKGENNISFWIYFDKRKYDMPEASINLVDKYGLITDTIKLNVRSENNVYNNWIRIDKDVNFKSGFVYQLLIEGDNIAVDNLLIQPRGSNVYLRTGNTEILNNFIL